MSYTDDYEPTERGARRTERASNRNQTSLYGLTWHGSQSVRQENVNGVH